MHECQETAMKINESVTVTEHVRGRMVRVEFAARVGVVGRKISFHADAASLAVRLARLGVENASETARRVWDAIVGPAFST